MAKASHAAWEAAAQEDEKQQQLAEEQEIGPCLSHWGQKMFYPEIFFTFTVWQSVVPKVDHQMFS